MTHEENRSMRRIALALLLCSLTACVAHLGEENLVIPRAGEALPAGRSADGQWTIEPLLVTPAPGVQLRGAWFHRPGAVATVLYFGGNGFVLAHHYPYVLGSYRDLPVDVVAFDHRGYGASTGHATIDALLADGTVLYDAMRARPELAGRPLLVHGHSLGSFIAGDVARTRHLDGLVLESSATTAAEWVQGFVDHSLLLRRVDVAPALRGRGNAAVMATLDEPLLVVVGSRDETTRPPMSRALYAAAATPAKELLVVEGAGHMDAARQPPYRDAFGRLLQRAQAVFAARGSDPRSLQGTAP
ncbi:MAG: alpha/beta hydrolase [Lysobacteraceae bacterium]